MNRIRPTALAAFLGASVLVLHGRAAVARGEACPTLDDLASPRFLLIVHCRAEELDGRVLYKVLDVWKGEYRPTAFVKQPPAGYIDTTGPEGAAASRVAGAEAILVYTKGNQPAAGIDRHDMILAVRNGKLCYPVDEFESREYTVAEFKREILSRQDEPNATDLTGAWRMLLPAGFDHEATIQAVGENRYRIASGGSRFNGIYEKRGKKLVAVEPPQTVAEGFVWELRSPYMLTLIEQSEKPEHDYRGAVLFRPSKTASRPSAPEDALKARNRERPLLSKRLGSTAGEDIKIPYRRGFSTALPPELLREYWASVKNNTKMQGQVLDLLSLEQIDSIWMLEVHIAVVANFDQKHPGLIDELFAFLYEGNRFQTGPLPEGFEHEYPSKYLVALFRTTSGDYGLITRYKDFVVIELAGYVGVAPIERGK